MKLEGNQKLTIKNVANAKIILGAFALEHEATATINPYFISNETKIDLEYYIATGQIEVSIADVDDSKTDRKETSDVVSKETVKNDKGETHKHVVYDPETASKNRVIAVEPIDIGKAIETEENKLDIINFLEKHWKTIEKELENISSVERLNKLLAVANEQGIKEGNKKYELIKNRIKKLQ